MKKSLILLILIPIVFLSCFDSKNGDRDEDSADKPQPVGISNVAVKKSVKSDLGTDIVYLGQNFDFTITLTSKVSANNVPLNIYFVKADKFPDMKALADSLAADNESTAGDELAERETTIGSTDITDPAAIKDDPDLKNMIAADPVLIPTLKKGTYTYDISVFVPQRSDVENSSDWKVIAVIDGDDLIESIGETVNNIGTLDQEGKIEGSFEQIYLPVAISNEKMLVPDIALEWVIDQKTNLPLFTDVIVLPAEEAVAVDDNGNAIFNEPLVDDTNVYIEGNLRVYALNDTVLNVPVTFELYTGSDELVTKLEVWDSDIDGFSDSYVIAELPKDIKNRVVPFSLVIPDGEIRSLITSKGQLFKIKATASAPAGVTEVDAEYDQSRRNNSVTFDIQIIQDALPAARSSGSYRTRSGIVRGEDPRSPGLEKSKEYNAKLGNDNFGVEILNQGKLEVNSTVGAMVTLSQDRNITVMRNTLSVNSVEFVAQFAPQSPTDTHAHLKFSVLGVNLYYWERAVSFSKEKKWETQKEKAYPPTVVMVGPVPINLQAGIQGSVGFKITAYLDSEQPEGADDPKSIFNAEGGNELNDAYQKLKEENEARQKRWKDAKEKEEKSKGIEKETSKDERRIKNADDKQSGEDEERPGVEYPGSTEPGNGGLIAEAGPYISAGAFAQASLGIPGFFEAGIKGSLDIVNIELLVKGMVKFALEDYLPEHWEARDVLVSGSGSDFSIVALSDVKPKLWTEEYSAALKAADGSLILADDEGNPVYADSWSYFVQGAPILEYEAVTGDENTAGSLLYNLKTKNSKMYQHYLDIKSGTIKNSGDDRLEFRKYQLGDVNALVFFPSVEFAVELTLAGPSGSVGPFAKMYYPKICNARSCFSFRFFGRRYTSCWTIYYPCGFGSTDWYYPLAEFSSWSKTYPLLAFAMPYKDEWKIRIPMDTDARNIITQYGLRVSSPAAVEPERRLALFGVDLSKIGTDEKLVDINLPADIRDYSN